MCEEDVFDRTFRNINTLVAKKAACVLAEKYEVFLRTFRTVPDERVFSCPETGTILDENRSVAWNRAEVQRLRKEFFEFFAEKERLIEKRAFLDKSYREGLVKLLSEEYELSKEEGEIVFSRAYEDEHSYGIIAVKKRFEELAEMVLHLKSKERGAIS